jgi:Fur family transcriptional regulator, ferric uptake regulator
MNMKAAEIESLVAGVAERLRGRGLRRTKALDLLITEMAKNGRPMTIADLSGAPGLSGQCDPATIYRLLMKLEEHGVVRRLGLHDRSTYFILVQQGRHHDYLVCTGCGQIAEIDIECPVRTLEGKLEKLSGYRHVYHELEFFGVCPACHDGKEHEGKAHCC